MPESECPSPARGVTCHGRRSLRRVLIANRGEIALRAVRACRQLSLESVAVYSSADANSAHRWAADHAVCIGPPPPKASYLNAAALIETAVATKCDAVYPGYGFLAENAKFAQLCAENDLNFIGPNSECITQMGDKVAARQAAASIGVPVVPGSEGGFTSADAAEAAAGAIGYPQLLKASGGGGGRGMRVVNRAEEFRAQFDQASAEAQAAFNNGEIYLERFFPQVRHIEIQVFGDKHGNYVHLGERDCSVQRRHQKLIEESPSPVINQKTRREMAEAARARQVAKIRERRHDRVHLRHGERKILLHRNEHTYPGRASGDGNGHRNGPDPRAIPGRSRGAALLRLDVFERPRRDRVSRQCRGCEPEFPALARHLEALAAAERTKHPRRQSRLRKLRGAALLRLDAR